MPLPSRSQSSYSLQPKQRLQAIEVIFSSESGPTASEASQSFFLMVDHYLREIVRLILTRSANSASLTLTQPPRAYSDDQVQDLSLRIIQILLSREFNYQSKNRVAHHIPRLATVIARHIRRDEPIPLFYDLGGGYHAATFIDDVHPYTWNITMGELLVLFQISKFDAEIVKYYPPGVHFNLIIDDGVAQFINDIPVLHTRAYCATFRQLIRCLGLSKRVSLLVQTELWDWSARVKNLPYSPKPRITEVEHHNVMRFLGRRCSAAEAADRIGKHDAAISVSELQIGGFVKQEIRLLQRSDECMLTFRPFPGGAARIQCGRLGLLLQRDKPIPFLVTTRARETYDCIPVTIDPFQIITSVQSQLGSPRSDWFEHLSSF